MYLWFSHGSGIKGLMMKYLLSLILFFLFVPNSFAASCISSDPCYLFLSGPSNGDWFYWNGEKAKISVVDNSVKLNGGGDDQYG